MPHKEITHILFIFSPYSVSHAVWTQDDIILNLNSEAPQPQSTPSLLPLSGFLWLGCLVFCTGSWRVKPESGSNE